MGVDKRSGDKFITKRPTGADVPFTDQSPDVASNANIAQLAADLYTAPSLDNDGLPNLVSPMQTVIPPVGSIIPHYDFNGAVAITGAWKYCDGSAVVDAASPINGQILPDLSGRYLVGFGTDGAGDNDTAVFSTTAVGNAGHTINLQHLHTVNAEASHTHGPGSLAFKWLHHENTFKSLGVINTWVLSGATEFDFIKRNNEAATAATNGQKYMQADFTTWDAYTANSGNAGTSGAGSSHTHTTVNALSTAQSIQPRSIRVRYIMRIK